MELWQLDVMGRVFLADGTELKVATGIDDGTELKVATGIDDHSRFCIAGGKPAQLLGPLMSLTP